MREGVSHTASTPPRSVTAGGRRFRSGLERAAGETVTIEAQECGKTAFGRARLREERRQRRLELGVKPTVNTVYRSSWKNTTSAKFEVKVAPAVALVRVRVAASLPS